GRAQVLSFLVRVSADDRHTHYHVRLGKLLRGLECGAVCVQGGTRRRGAEVAGKAVAQPERARQTRARPARSEQPHRWKLHVRWHHSHLVKRVAFRELAPGEREQLRELAGELLGVEGTKSGGRDRVGPW